MFFFLFEQAHPLVASLFLEFQGILYIKATVCLSVYLFVFYLSFTYFFFSDRAVSSHP